MKLGYKIESVTNSESQRKQLIQFLATFEHETRGEEFWHDRLLYWWDMNPFYYKDIPKGWILMCQDEIVGFLGVIAFEYVYRGDIYKALATTTWRVSTEHRKYSLRLLTRFQSFRHKYILLNTTPNEVAKRVFTAYKYKLNDEVQNYYFPIRQQLDSAANILLNAAHLVQTIFSKEKNLKVVKLDDAFRIEKEHFDFKHLQKNVSRDYLIWYCNTPLLKKEFIGCIGANDILSSYLILKRNRIKSFDVLQVIDYYTAHCDSGELLALVRYVCENPETISISHGCKLLILSSFVTNQLFDKKGANIMSKRSKYSHYYSTPGVLNGVHKICHISEGDYGL